MPVLISNKIMIIFSDGERLLIRLLNSFKKNINKIHLPLLVEYTLLKDSYYGNNN